MFIQKLNDICQIAFWKNMHRGNQNRDTGFSQVNDEIAKTPF